MRASPHYRLLLIHTTQMPLLVNKLIFSIAPTRAPFFIRPLFWMIFGQLDRHLIVPELKKNLEMVSFSSYNRLPCVLAFLVFSTI